MKKFLLFIFTLPIFFSAQDNCATALPISLGVTTVGAIDGTADNACGWQTPAANAEWYSYTATADGALTITSNLVQNDGVTNSNDTRLSVFSGNCSALVCLDGADDISNSNYLTTLVFGVEAGVTYYLQWDSRWSSLGFDFETSFEAADCTVSFNFTEDFESDADFYGCYTTADVDGGGTSWIRQDLDLNSDGTPETFATNGATNVAEDDWLISPPITFSANPFTFTYKYNGASNGTANPASEDLEVVILDGPSPTANVITTLGTYPNIPQTGAFADLETMATTSTANYTFTSGGTYYLAFHVNSDTVNGFLLLFDYTISQDNLGVDDISQNGSVSVLYPNPVKTNFNLKLADNFDTNKTVITITDMNGKQVFSTNYSESINISQLAKGVYIATISDGINIENQKLIKE